MLERHSSVLAWGQVERSVFLEAPAPPGFPAATTLTVRGPGGLLTVLTAPHGGAEDALVFSVVERVAIPIHWVVEECEVPTDEANGSERAGLGTALVPLSWSLEGQCQWGHLSLGTMDDRHDSLSLR